MHSQVSSPVQIPITDTYLNALCRVRTLYKVIVSRDQHMYSRSKPSDDEILSYCSKYDAKMEV